MLPSKVHNLITQNKGKWPLLCGVTFYNLWFSFEYHINSTNNCCWLVQLIIIITVGQVPCPSDIESKIQFLTPKSLQHNKPRHSQVKGMNFWSVTRKMSRLCGVWGRGWRTPAWVKFGGLQSLVLLLSTQSLPSTRFLISCYVLSDQGGHVCWLLVGRQREPEFICQMPRVSAWLWTCRGSQSKSYVVTCKGGKNQQNLQPYSRTHGSIAMGRPTGLYSSRFNS